MEHTGSVVGFPLAEPVGAEDLLTLKSDILIPAALENAIDAAIAPRLCTKIIAEAANGPVTPDADSILEERGIFLIPDILCNAGGVTVSYFEWVQNEQHTRWDLHEVNGRLEREMKAAFRECSISTWSAGSGCVWRPTCSVSAGSPKQPHCAVCTRNRLHAAYGWWRSTRYSPRRLSSSAGENSWSRTPRAFSSR
jgi:glutamate dehydrogenase/leucine dehydrogenase